MSDDVYKFQKKPINTMGNLENASELAEMAKVRQKIMDEAKQQSNLGNMSVEENVVPISGNIPEKYKQYFDGSEGEQKGPRTRNSSLRAQGSDKLEQLLAGLNPNGGPEFEEIVLPSKGKFYNGSDGPKDGILHIRKMTGKEEEILANPRLIKKNQALNMIFDNCIQEPYKSEGFLAEDRTYLLIYLRGISYSEIYDVEIKCPECDKTFAAEIDLNNFMVDSCPDDFDENGLTGTLPQCGYKFSYRLPRGSDEREVQSYRDFKAKGGFVVDADAPDETLHFRTALLVNEIEGLTDKSELKVLIEKLPIGDVNYLRNTINNPPFGVDTKTPLECTYCQADFNTDLPLEASFFFTKDQKKNQTRA